MQGGLVSLLAGTTAVFYVPPKAQGRFGFPSIHPQPVGNQLAVRAVLARVPCYIFQPFCSMCRSVTHLIISDWTPSRCRARVRVLSHSEESRKHLPSWALCSALLLTTEYTVAWRSQSFSEASSLLWMHLDCPLHTLWVFLPTAAQPCGHRCMEEKQDGLYLPSHRPPVWCLLCISWRLPSSLSPLPETPLCQVLPSPWVFFTL